MYKKILTITLLAFTLCSTLEAQKMPKRADVLKAMNCANDYFIRKYPDATKPTFVKRERPSNLWTRGVYFEGLMELIKLNPNNQQNTDYMESWGSFHKWTPRNGVKTRDADDYCCSQAYLDYYNWEKYISSTILKTSVSLKVNLVVDASMIEPTKTCMANLMEQADTKPDSNSKAKFNGSSIHDWTWIDAIQMGLPVLTTLEAMADTKEEAEAYSKQAYRMYIWTRDTLAGGLFNEAEGLWWRDKDFVPPYKEPNGENCYWSRGNGWVYAALVRAMEDAMESKNKGNHNDHFSTYKADFLSMTKALVKCQRKDYFWNCSLHDDTHFGGKELTGTSLFIYGMAWGVRNNMLDKETYLPIIAKTWKAMVKKCLHKNGFLGYVQGTGKEPKDSQPVGYDTEPDFDDYGLGCFLLAGSEVYKLAWEVKKAK